MPHISLYRRYRPKNFDELIGQDSIVRILRNQIVTNEVSHAYIFTGTRGVGKTSAAKIFAKAVNCLTPVNGSPCGHCRACKSLSDDNNLDIIELDAASNSGVENIRSLRDDARYAPSGDGVRYKVFIIDEVHALSGSAFNAFLKTLEEPPQHVIFILATTDIHKIPMTILSRCLRFDFKLLSKEALSKHLVHIFDENSVKYTIDGIAAIAEAGQGSVRDSLSIADTCISYASGGIIDYGVVMEVLGANVPANIVKLLALTLDGNESEMLLELNGLASNGKNIQILAQELSEYLNYIYIAKVVKDANAFLSLPVDLFAEIKSIADRVGEKELLTATDIFIKGEQQLRFATKPLIILSATLSKIGFVLRKGELGASTIEVNYKAATNTTVQKATSNSAAKDAKLTLSSLKPVSPAEIDLEMDIINSEPLKAVATPSTDELEKRIYDKVMKRVLEQGIIQTASSSTVEKNEQEIVKGEELCVEYTEQQFEKQRLFKDNFVQFLKSKNAVIIAAAIADQEVFIKRPTKNSFEICVTQSLTEMFLKNVFEELVKHFSEHIGEPAYVKVRLVVKEKPEDSLNTDVFLQLFNAKKVKIS